MELNGFAVRYCHQLHESMFNIVPAEVLWVALGLPLLYLYFIEFTKNPKAYRKGVLDLIFIEYIALMLCYAVVFREVSESSPIQTEFFWGYKNPPNPIVKDNIANILIFVPIGFLACGITEKNKYLKAIFIGLLVSETIECSQLIFKRGSFDVDDIINNLVGTILGVVVYGLFVMTKRFVPHIDKKM